MENSVRLGILDLEEVGGKIGGSGGHEFAANSTHCSSGGDYAIPKQVVPESVIRRDEVPAVELLILYEPVPIVLTYCVLHPSVEKTYRWQRLLRISSELEPVLTKTILARCTTSPTARAQALLTVP